MRTAAALLVLSIPWVPEALAAASDALPVEEAAAEAVDYGGALCMLGSCRPLDYEVDPSDLSERMVVAGDLDQAVVFEAESTWDGEVWQLAFVHPDYQGHARCSESDRLVRCAGELSGVREEPVSLQILVDMTETGVHDLGALVLE